MATQKLCGKIKPFDTGFEPTMFHLANGRINLKFSNSPLVQKNISSMQSKFVFNFHTDCE